MERFEVCIHRSLGEQLTRLHCRTEKAIRDVLVDVADALTRHPPPAHWSRRDLDRLTFEVDSYRIHYAIELGSRRITLRAVTPKLVEVTGPGRRDRRLAVS